MYSTYADKEDVWVPTNLLVEAMVIELRPGGQVMSNLCATPLQCWNQSEECVVQPA